MAEETTPEIQDDSVGTTDAPEGLTASVPEAAEQPSTTASQETSPSESDTLQPFIDKAGETIQHEVEATELSKFLRANIKTFREEWDPWPDSAKDAYVHMMTSQLVQRKAAAIQISIGNEFKLPVPSAQTTLFESLKRSQVKPQKRQPVLLLAPNLRPTYSLK